MALSWHLIWSIRAALGQLAVLVSPQRDTVVGYFCFLPQQRISKYLMAFRRKWINWNPHFRYGALAGFGLSLAKWTIIVKNSTDFASNENVWLWWLITAFGMLVCMRAVFQVYFCATTNPLMRGNRVNKSLPWNFTHCIGIFMLWKETANVMVYYCKDKLKNILDYCDITCPELP